MTHLLVQSELVESISQGVAEVSGGWMGLGAGVGIISYRV